ncbi:HAD family hydrolase [Clostridium oryzae]|uniref:Phosphoglycolate phosphatase n=1 Tax=Clostridium oryzae TaxID=1450648 RepID=A0A1V4IVC8_9CLOT|nr:HAD family hydrolase [Clostridium oryzae]OPJ63780.1 phosphoglycolate phosphatase [Clostridium oryzae]
MKSPKMILFDYGHTLVYEPAEDHIKGAEAILSHATYNPKNITAEELNRRQKELFDEQSSVLRARDLEVMGQKLDMLLFEMLGLKFDLTPNELEYESWIATESIEPMEGIGEVLTYLNENGIRSGVISNMAHSEKVLARRINEILPMNKFEFILASSEYLYRKPHPHMFEVAISKSQLKPEDIWYCGDNIVFDVESSAACGMFPVWYESRIKCTYRKPFETEPECEHLHIRSWKELIKVLQLLSRKVLI